MIGGIENNYILEKSCSIALPILKHIGKLKQHCLLGKYVDALDLNSSQT